MSRKRKTLNRKQKKLEEKFRKSQFSIPFPAQYEEVVSASYSPSLCTRIIRFCEEGAQVVEFASELNVSMATLNEWAAMHPEFREAMDTAEAKMEAYWWKMAEDKCREQFSLKVWEQMMTRILQFKSFRYSSAAEKRNTIEEERCVVILPELKDIEAYKLIESRNQQ